MVRIQWGSNKNYDYATLFAGYNDKKLALVYSDYGSSNGRGGSSVAEVDMTRWTHLAATLNAGSSEYGLS